jgi:ribokinase
VIDTVVVGQIARDLVLVVDEPPEANGSSRVRQRREMLGGKGANQAVALAQLGASPALVGVVGDDEVGGQLLASAAADGVEVSPVVRRPGTATALIVDIVDASAHWRYLEHLPDPVLLTEADVACAAPVLRAAPATIVQLQQPPAAALVAARCAKDAGRMVVLDGAPDDLRDSIVDSGDVLRADARESEILAGTEVRTAGAAARLAHRLLRRHELTLVALAVDGVGNVFVWDGGHEVLPLIDTEVVDTTGAGDAFTAALTSSLCRGSGPRAAARIAVAAAAATVGHPGGRPRLTAGALDEYLERLDA